MHDLYGSIILDHGQNPRNRGLLQPADVDFGANNAACGDRLRLTLRLDANRRIIAVGWGGDGCAVSQASASMLGEMILGKTLEEVRCINRQIIFDMLGAPVSHSRERCALLPLHVLVMALFGPGEWRRREGDDEL